jgi:hypothetical protein
MYHKMALKMPDPCFILIEPKESDDKVNPIQKSDLRETLVTPMK